MRSALAVTAVAMVLAFASRASATDRGDLPSRLIGPWAYRTDCNFGHDVELNVQKTSPTVEGTWSDGTRNEGSEGQFKGTWRDGKLFVRFCSEDGGVGDYPACPSYSEEAGYLAPAGPGLAWYRVVGAPSEGHFEKYVLLRRKPEGGDVVKDMGCGAGE